ncbi:MAG: hypothetical protein AAFX58_14665 [Pseudomonadota bacterium]
MPECAAPERHRNGKPGGDGSRYALRIDRNARGDRGLTIVDLHRRAVLTRIGGREARYLLKSRCLPASATVIPPKAFRPS